MAEVFEVHDAKLDRSVALKRLMRHAAAEPELLHKFLDEARRLASLDEHDAILPVHECDEADGMPYITMRLIDGGSLQPVVAAGKPIPVSRLRSLTAAIGGALDFAHQRGIVHCDVKPDNILVDRNERPYLADFGISRLVADFLAGDEDQPMVYTPSYASPEQIRGEQPGTPSDTPSMLSRIARTTSASELNSRPSGSRSS